MEIGYYPGCALHGSSNDYEKSVRACFDVLGVALRELDDWICCGATAAHSLNQKLAVALPARNLAIAERDGSIVWEEGCLSVPEFTAPVTRAKRILLRAWTPDQQEIEIEADDLLAVALQHELDHLDGKLFLDRISRLKRELYRTRQRKLERQGRAGEGGGSDRSAL